MQAKVLHATKGVPPQKKEEEEEKELPPCSVKSLAMQFLAWLNWNSKLGEKKPVPNVISSDWD